MQQTRGFKESKDSKGKGFQVKSGDLFGASSLFINVIEAALCSASLVDEWGRVWARLLPSTASIACSTRAFVFYQGCEEPPSPIPAAFNIPA